MIWRLMAVVVLFWCNYYTPAQLVITGKMPISGSTRVDVTGTGGTFTVNVISVSNTQAMIGYTAPTTGVCSIQGSESASYSPQVHDLDQTLFTNANLDDRAGNLGVGTTARVSMIGTRVSNLSLDTVTYYSRALQANTTHYVKVTCGSSVGTASFATTNVPVGSTFNEPPLADPAVPGGWTLPTLSGARNQIIIDPQTGIQNSRVSIQADITDGGSFGHTIFDGAQTRPCGGSLHTATDDGAQGYLCNLDGKQGHHDAYFIIPATGQARYLGYNHLASNANIDDSLNIYAGDSTQETPSAGTVTIGLGAKTWGTGDSSPLFTGLRARASHCTTRVSGNCTVIDPTNFVEGPITFYGCPAGCHLDINVDLVGGSGTFSDWAIFGVDNTFVYTYTGGFVAVSPGTPIPVSGPVQFTGVSGAILIHNFDATFDLSHYGSTSCTRPGGPAFSYTAILCGGQDSYGYIAAFYGGDGRPIPTSCMVGDAQCPRVVAAWNTLTDPRFKYCGIHASLGVPNTSLFTVNWHGMSTNTMDQGNTTLGIAGWFSYLSANFLAGVSTFTVTADPVSLAAGGDPITPVPVPAAGDRIQINAGANGVRTLTAKSGNTWTINSPLSANVSTGQNAQMFCTAPASTDDGNWAIVYFDLSDTSGSTVIFDIPWPGGGHFDIGPLGRVSEAGAGYGFVKTGSSPYIDSLNQPITIINSTASWNGIASPGFGNLLTKHPSMQQLLADPVADSYFTDRVAFSGGDPSSGSGGRYYSSLLGADPVSGQLYKYNSDSLYPLHRKLVPTLAKNGYHSLRDISGPGSAITNGSGDGYKYCVVRVAGECRGGSSTGDIFVNSPTVDILFCDGGDAPVSTNFDLCVADVPAYAGGAMQFFMGTNSANSQAGSRNLGGGMVMPEFIYVFPLLKTSAQAEFTLWTHGIVINTNPGGINAIDVWKSKLPPLPAPDGVDRTAFIPTAVVVSAGSQNNAIAKFWYRENHNADGNDYCGSRAEDCYATAATIPAGADPYKYPTDGSGGVLTGVTGLACSSGCTLSIPAITGHMLYYQVVLRNSSNVILSTGPTQIVAIP